MIDNTKVNYGPLAGMIGIWSGNKGSDLAPEPDGTETNEYYETMIFTEAGDVSNAEEQAISAVHYMQKVQRISNDNVIHQETGYWMWEQDSHQVMHSLTIPRGMAVLAGGSVKEDKEITFDVQASIDSKDWQVIQSPFMREKAKLRHYKQQLILAANSLSYSQTMELDIYGSVFKHTDKNTLARQ